MRSKTRRYFFKSLGQVEDGLSPLLEYYLCVCECFGILLFCVVFVFVVCVMCV